MSEKIYIPTNCTLQAEDLFLRLCVNPDVDRWVYQSYGQYSQNKKARVELAFVEDIASQETDAFSQFVTKNISYASLFYAQLMLIDNQDGCFHIENGKPSRMHAAEKDIVGGLTFDSERNIFVRKKNSSLTTPIYALTMLETLIAGDSLTEEISHATTIQSAQQIFLNGLVSHLDYSANYQGPVEVWMNTDPLFSQE